MLKRMEWKVESKQIFVKTKLILTSLNLIKRNCVAIFGHPVRG